jgi:hypothetical protein
MLHRILHRNCTAFCSALEVGVGDLQVVLDDANRDAPAVLGALEADCARRHRERLIQLYVECAWIQA